METYTRRCPMEKHQLTVLPDHLYTDDSGQPVCPRSRVGEMSGPVACPWLGCKHNLGLHSWPKTGRLSIGSGGDDTRSLRLRDDNLDEFGDRAVELWLSMRVHCVLDAIDYLSRPKDDGLTLKACGDLLRLTRERARQIESTALLQLLAADGLEVWSRDFGMTGRQIAGLRERARQYPRHKRDRRALVHLTERVEQPPA
jgi:hypothetical protein